MTVRLVKQKQQNEVKEKAVQQPTTNQLLATTQGWVQEFRDQKARTEESLSGLIRRI
jgi:hypothetical protein